MSVIVVEFITLDGVVSDPDGCLSAGKAGKAGAAVLARYGRAAR